VQGFPLKEVMLLRGTTQFDFQEVRVIFFRSWENIMNGEGGTINEPSYKRIYKKSSFGINVHFISYYLRIIQKTNKSQKRKFKKFLIIFYFSIQCSGLGRKRAI